MQSIKLSSKAVENCEEILSQIFEVVALCFNFAEVELVLLHELGLLLEVFDYLKYLLLECEHPFAAPIYDLGFSFLV
jgi:hypothetical protein